MADYTPPVRDIRFALDVIGGIDELFALPDFAHLDSSLTGDLLAEFARVCRDVVAPSNRSGDRQPARLDAETGLVTTSPGFAEAYAALVDGGWSALPFDPAYGGGGFPWTVNLALQEMFTSANMALSLCPMLTQGVIDGLLHHGSERQRELYLAPMVAGRWTGTMNLTEPEAGSDVGALRTRAVQMDDGRFRLFGQKIYITFGEHDLTENIIHLVLARLPDAPVGTRGISLFVVPKFLVNDDGSLGERNDLRCLSLEHKMGINGSPTCVMSFGDRGEGAIGELVGEPNTGMRGMFTIMNNARLAVGLEGVAIAERALQDAMAYAQVRVQGRVADADAGSTIIGHPDVRRMLLSMRASVEAARAVCYCNARYLDLARHSPDATVRQHHQELADLFTPLSKAWSTDLGVEVASTAIQVFGGMGFIEETGAAQHYRDARIAPIYEGTNGIQAIDLVSRKVPMRGGAVVTELLDTIRATVDTIGRDSIIGARLAAAVDATAEATQWLVTAAPADALAGASDYLRLLATTVGGWLLARQAEAADGHDDGFHRAKVVVATFFAEHELARVDGWRASVISGSATVMALRPDELASS
jgi:alkylation response protein AidB-like acyl-CoA dehydrogenase